MKAYSRAPSFTEENGEEKLANVLAPYMPYSFAYVGSRDEPINEYVLTEIAPMIRQVQQDVHEKLLVPYSMWYKAALYLLVRGIMRPLKKPEPCKKVHIRILRQTANVFAVQMRVVACHMRMQWYALAGANIPHFPLFPPERAIKTQWQNRISATLRS